MRFLLDESADLPIAPWLRNQGHDARSITRDYSHALLDREVLAIAHAEGRVLITNDRDFGALVFLHHLPHAGVILFRLGKEDLATKIAWLEYVLIVHANDLNHFLVVTDRGVRIRRTGAL